MLSVGAIGATVAVGYELASVSPPLFFAQTSATSVWSMSVCVSLGRLGFVDDPVAKTLDPSGLATIESAAPHDHEAGNNDRASADDQGAHHNRAGNDNHHHCRDLRPLLRRRLHPPT